MRCASSLHAAGGDYAVSTSSSSHVLAHLSPVPTGRRVSRASTRPECAQRELRICTNKTCKKQGSKEVSCPCMRTVRTHVFATKVFNSFVDVLTLQVAQYALDLQLADVKVITCGCLGELNSGLGCFALSMVLAELF